MTSRSHIVTSFAGLCRTARGVFFLLTALVGFFGLSAPLATQESGSATVLRFNGAVSPATSDYITRGLEDAAERGAEIVILQMDTPGGLDTSMREIIRAILASPVPVASFVAPSGARAASAGTYIMYASHVAAMAPGTNLGAATPVAVGGGGGLPFGGGETEEEPSDQEDAEDESGDTPAQTPQNASETKAINDAVAYIRSLANLRGRNAEWAERAVREAASLSASSALEQDVIDFIAPDIPSLLNEADGRTISLGNSQVTLETEGLPVEEVTPDWRTEFLAIITNPNIALILMMIGIYGLIFEFLNPGALLPGTVGAVSLLTGLYAMAVLPVTYAGAALMLLGVALIVAEAFAPSFGVLGLGGTVGLVLGATILFDTDVPGLQLSWQVIAAVGTLSLGITLVIIRLAWSSHRRRVVTGEEQLIGETGTAQDWNGTRGYVFVHGERWNAISTEPLEPGDEIRVTGRNGLVLKVAAADTQNSDSRGENP
ncbi:NfeD family protein [Chelativorans sp. YIM 93263]|uniref:NfeD family protein n=1 Tax=Chelativorans sp. YIM 93263 TaxID=2906648 RepID=UPI002379E2E2|nr:nodulation protein NfeD [Chelativorans sp. YIM 93263]